MAMQKLFRENDNPVQKPPENGQNEREPAAPDAEETRKVARRRSEALRGFFPQLATWRSNRIHFARMREIESYLAQATDLADLEQRVAQIERSARGH